MGNDEVGTLVALKSHRDDVIDPAIAAHHGRVVKVMGDGLLVEFPSVVEATQCAVDIQQIMAKRNAAEPGDRRIEFRIGINLGDIIVEGDDIHGDSVNIAARLEALAEPGGICIRRAVRNQVRDKLPYAYEDMGEIEVKNITRPIRVFRVLLDGDVAATGSAPSTRPWLWPAVAAAAASSSASSGSSPGRLARSRRPSHAWLSRCPTNRPSPYCHCSICRTTRHKLISPTV